MLDGMEELTFDGKLFDSIHLIPIMYAYVACLKVAMWFVLGLYCLLVFMVYWEITYSEPFQTSKMKLFVKKPPRR